MRSSCLCPQSPTPLQTCNKLPEDPKTPSPQLTSMSARSTNQLQNQQKLPSTPHQHQQCLSSPSPLKMKKWRFGKSSSDAMDAVSRSNVCLWPILMSITNALTSVNSSATREQKIFLKYRFLFPQTLVLSNGAANLWPNYVVTDRGKSPPT